MTVAATARSSFKIADAERPRALSSRKRLIQACMNASAPGSRSSPCPVPSCSARGAVVRADPGPVRFWAPADVCDPLEGDDYGDVVTDRPRARIPAMRPRRRHQRLGGPGGAPRDLRRAHRHGLPGRSGHCPPRRGSSALPGARSAHLPRRRAITGRCVTPQGWQAKASQGGERGGKGSPEALAGGHGRGRGVAVRGRYGRPSRVLRPGCFERSC